MKKLLSLLIIFLFIFVSIPLVTGCHHDSIEINISAGLHNRQIGFEIIKINIINKLEEEIIVNYDYYFDSIYGMAIPQFYFENTTIKALKSKDIIINIKDSIASSWYGLKIFNFDLKVIVDDIQIEKKELTIKQFVLLWDQIFNYIRQHIRR